MTEEELEYWLTVLLEQECDIIKSGEGGSEHEQS